MLLCQACIWSAADRIAGVTAVPAADVEGRILTAFGFAVEVLHKVSSSYQSVLRRDRLASPTWSHPPPRKPPGACHPAGPRVPAPRSGGLPDGRTTPSRSRPTRCENLAVLLDRRCGPGIRCCHLAGSGTGLPYGTTENRDGRKRDSGRTVRRSVRHDRDTPCARPSPPIKNSPATPMGSGSKRWSTT